MKRFAIAGLFLASLTVPALADSKPSPRDISGLKILGDKSGYSSLFAAEQEIKSDSGVCNGVVSRA